MKKKSQTGTAAQGSRVQGKGPGSLELDDDTGVATLYKLMRYRDPAEYHALVEKQFRGVRETQLKLSPLRQAQILLQILLGNHVRVAAKAAGVTGDTVEKWIEKGEQEGIEPYKTFMFLVREAESNIESTVVQAWVSQIPTDWRAAEAFLEKRFHERWGKRSEVGVHANVTHTFRIEHYLAARQEVEAFEQELLPAPELKGKSKPPRVQKRRGNRNGRDHDAGDSETTA
jgi:transposase